ncbi:MAG: hypothetical protein Q9221_002846 [Calogaya cf. arnoldii]
MRSHALTLVLLAVVSNNVSAGLLRYKEHSVRHRHYGRSYNESSIAAAFPQPAESISAQSLSSSQIPTQSSTAPSVLPTNRSKQVGSIPAEGSGQGAAKFDQQSSMQSSSTATMESPQSSAPAGTRTKQVGSVPAEGSGRDAAKIDQQSLARAQGSGTGAATLHVESASPQTSMNKPTTTFATKSSLGTGVATPSSQLQTSQVSSRSTLSQLPAASGGEVTASSPTASSTSKAAGPSLSVTPTTGGNLAMAVAFNQVYKTLTLESQCNPQDRLQMTVCINGLFASCTDAGRYTVSPCAEGKQCFALPLMAEGSTGINVMCESPSKAARALEAESTAKSSPNTGSPATTKVPSLSTKATLSASSMSSSLVTSSDQSANTQGTELSSAQPNLQTSTPSNVEPSVVAETVATTEPSATLTSSFQTSTTSIATQSRSTTFSEATTPSTTPITTSKESTAEQASSSTDIPLIISFPSSLPLLPEKSDEAQEPTKMLFPALAAVAQTSVAFAEKLAQPSPSQQAPDIIPTSAATPVGVATAETTVLAMAYDDDNNLEKRTVTVTVTTTERL